jgi:hypothetical protein
MKTCKHCHETKSLTEFRQTGKYFQASCRICERKIRCKWAKAHRAQATETARKYREANAEQHAETVKRYNAAHPDRRRKTHSKYVGERKKTDINFRLACNLRSRLGQALKNNSKKGSAVKDLGCSISDLKLYLESKFQPGMDWSNWNKTGWHIDHIKPLVSFNLEDPIEFQQAVHYTNLQPLWAKDNLIKGST